MVRIIIALLFISFQAVAETCSSEMLLTKTNGDKISLCFVESKKDYVSKTCLKDCEAKKFLDSSVVLTTKELKGGKDPHSVACTKLSGKLFLYRDEKQNEYAYCEADDGSAVSADLINYKMK
jgi:putative hemolysin